MTLETSNEKARRNDLHRFLGDNYGIYFRSRPDIEGSIHVKDIAPGILVLKQRLPFASKFAYPLVFEYQQEDMCTWIPVALDDDVAPDLIVMASCGELSLGDLEGAIEGTVSIKDNSKKLHRLTHDILFKNFHTHKFGSLISEGFKVDISLVLFGFPSQFDYENSLTYARYAALGWLYNEHIQNSIKVPDVVTLGKVWNRI